MPRMSGDGYGFCRTPDGRTIPCNQPPDNGLAQLALMLRGSGWLDRDYAGSGNAASSTYQSHSANTSRPAYENSWAAMPDNVGPFDAGSHLPITKAQEFLFTPADPYIDVLPWRPYAPEYIPIPPRPMPFPPVSRPLPVPQDIPPFEGPNRLGPYENPDEDWPFPETEECKEEIDNAHRFCRNHVRKLKSGLDTGKFGNSVIQCMRGMLSEECGGNPVRLGA